MNRNPKRARLAILISEKIDFKIRNLTTDKREDFILINVSIQ